MLRSDGFEVRHATPEELPAAAGPDTPHVVLASASLGLKRLVLLQERFADGESKPHIVVFPESDLLALEACVEGGFDYLAPPFRAALVRSRVASSACLWHAPAGTAPSP